MALAQLDTIRKVFDRVRDANHGDGELLTRYRQRRDQEAFGSLVRRHGPMVLGVCRRVLRDDHAAEDAFQATFIVLAKKADAVRPPERLAPWLYGVAYRTALKARGRAFRRRQVEEAYAAEMSNRAPTPSDDAADLLPVIDEQLNALPEKYRTPLLLCALQGLNKSEAAERLGLPEGTVSSRLARAREMLRDRLARRGVVVPAAALGALLVTDTLQAAVPPALAATATELATGSALVPTTVLTLSHEVLRSMTLLKLQTLCAVATCVSLALGGFGLYATRAEEKPAPPAPGEKPTNEKPKPEKPTNEQPRPEKPGTKPDGEKPDKPKPEGEKPRLRKTSGQVASVDAKDSTMMLALKGDGGIVERMVKVAPDAKVFIDNKEAKLADVPKNSFAALLLAAGKEGELPTATEVRVTGPIVSGAITLLGDSSVTFGGENDNRSYKLAPDGKVTINGKEAKFGDLKVGDKVTITMKADGSAALLIAGGKPVREGDGDKPAKPGEGERPVKNPKFGGKISEVDAAARTLTLAAKGEGGKVLVVKLTADAKVTVDGKEVKLADVPKGAFATLTLASAKDGQLREASEVVVAGPTFGGSVKRIDATTITIGTEKLDRVIKLQPTIKVTVNGKDAKLADLKEGDRVTVTLSSDETTAVSIAAGEKQTGDKPRREGDKPKPDKEEESDQ